MSKKKDIIILDKMDENVSTNFVRGYKTFWPFLKPYFFWAVLGVILTIPVGALDAVVASFLKPFMDNVMVAQDAQFSKLVPIFIIGFTVIQGICIYASNIVNAYVGSKVSMDLKNALFKKLLRFESRFFDKNTSGSVIMRFAGDADTATSGLIANLKLFLQKFFSSLALVVVLLYNSWELSFIAVGVLLLIVYPMKIVRKRIKQITLRTLSSGAKLNTYYYETYSGIKTIKSFNLQDEMTTSYKDNYRSLFILGMKIVRDTNWLAPFMHLVTAFGVAGVLYFGLHLIETKDITAGTFVAFLAALIMLYTPVKSIGNNYIAVQNSLLALDRISQLLHVESFESASEDGKVTLTEIKKDITFENVTFSYDGEKTILDNINLTVPVGTKVALVGNSGGGKSTVCSLIPRLYEIDKGSIKVDGKDIRDLSLSSLRDKISMVFQDNFLFAGTIRDNLLYGKKDATQEELEFAIKSAYLDDFIDKLPDGLDTVIGERGLLLSGGQRQRLAIARAILKNAPLVILDEATSALDNKSEKVVQRALDKLMEGRTTIVIAHRLSTVMDSDMIYVINDGHIVEQGSHQQLVELGGAYSVLYKSQFSKTHNNSESEKTE
ncbi:MAG: ATP-binding cassette domain-containing protein [Succinivibrio sp.]|nr:ATP-binding cassette domain-containing protein [Succinivibrio sp.]